MEHNLTRICLLWLSGTTEVSPVVSTDNTLLFVTAVIEDSEEMFCVDASSGRLQWAHNSNDDGYVAKPIYRSRDGDASNGVLYTVSVSFVFCPSYPDIRFRTC